MGTDDTQVIRIEAGEKIGSFKPECVNNVVRVTGTLVEDRIAAPAILARVHRLLRNKAGERSFVTASLSLFDPATGSFELTNAGDRTFDLSSYTTTLITATFAIVNVEVERL